MSSYAVKAATPDAEAGIFRLPGEKTMYGGKRVLAGDTIFVFASENEAVSGSSPRAWCSRPRRRPGEPMSSARHLA